MKRLILCLLLCLVLSACTNIKNNTNAIIRNDELTEQSDKQHLNLDFEDYKKNIENGKIPEIDTNASLYSNPIDEYFLPLIASASPQIAYRELQDTYREVWKSEFDNIILWMMEKCEYQEDKNKIEKYVESVNLQISIITDITITDWLDDYSLPPDSSDRNIWGNGTRSGLNQIEAEIYRNASMLLINHCGNVWGEKYLFQDIDFFNQY